VAERGASSARSRRLEAAEERGVTKGLLDTSVVIATDVAELPDEAAISAATLAELHFGVHVAPDDETRKARLHRLTEIEASFEPLPIDSSVARTYGALAHSVVTAGRSPRARVIDIFIAATARAHRLPLYTRNHDDFRVFERLIDVRYV
jgi:predicted nucleic acid-binding protein